MGHFNIFIFRVIRKYTSRSKKCTVTVVRKFKQRRRWQQQERQKAIGLDWQNIIFECASRFFWTFLCRHCTTTTWNYLISRFVEDTNTNQRLSFSFSELWYSPLKFNSRKICQHLTNWTRWNNRDKVWSSMKSLFKWRFRSRHCCCLSSLFTYRGTLSTRGSFWSSLSLWSLSALLSLHTLLSSCTLKPQQQQITLKS